MFINFIKTEIILRIDIYIFKLELIQGVDISKKRSKSFTGHKLYHIYKTFQFLT